MDEKGVLDKEYWRELYGLTEKFQPLANFDREEALFQLKSQALA